MLFVKSAKILAASLALAPLTGCAMATGTVFGKLLISFSHAPDLQGSLFSYSLLAFAFIETFCFFALGIVMYLLFI